MNDRRLSLCMIVKNEEKYIDSCLRSVKDYVDEMIIVDTGSTDRTMEICKSFGAQVLTFPWNGSFSDARNYGLERATGDWILWLDADEQVDSEDAKKLRDVLTYDDLILSIHLINYYGETPDLSQTLDLAHPRIFQNHVGFKFLNKIHETLNAFETLTRYGESLDIKVVPIKVYHSGYMSTVCKEKNKSQRNISMLEEELKQEGLHPWIEYYIACEYYNINKYKEAFDYINHSIMSFLKQSTIPPSHVYQLKYSILITSGNLEGAWPGIEKAIILYPDYVNLHYFKGLILYNKGLFKDAMETFEHCLEIGEENLDYLILKGAGSFQALYYKGCCLEKLGEIKAASRCYEQAASLSKTFDLPGQALRRLTEKNKNTFEDLPVENS